MVFPGSGNGKEVKGKEMNETDKTKSSLLSSSSGADIHKNKNTSSIPKHPPGGCSTGGNQTKERT